MIGALGRMAVKVSMNTFAMTRPAWAGVGKVTGLYDKVALRSFSCVEGHSQGWVKLNP